MLLVFLFLQLSQSAMSANPNCEGVASSANKIIRDYLVENVAVFEELQVLRGKASEKETLLRAGAKSLGRVGITRTAMRGLPDSARVQTARPEGRTTIARGSSLR